MTEEMLALARANAAEAGATNGEWLTDVVAEDHLTPSERAERGAWVGCGDGLHSAIVRAAKPAGAS